MTQSAPQPETLLLEESSRIALAAFLHDLGKFAERAKITVNKEMLEINKQLYCPQRKEFTDARGWFSHVHAAYTGIAMDVIERHLPDLTGANVAPFAAWRSTNTDDSLINAAAKHHKPETFLQWIIATADRVASGFDREEFEKYNAGEDVTPTKKNHYTARQLTSFEQINKFSNAEQDYLYRYPLKPLSPVAIFPVKAEDCETDSDKDAQGEYLALWNQFIQALEKIPNSHRQNWSLWLDHFETLWGTFTHAIPSATAFNIRPDVSLYDHSRVTAALATALWRYHHLRNETGADTARYLQEQDASWSDKKFLLVQGDFFGIQDFIFASGESHKGAAKLLRGRSFYVSLLTECAALKVLDTLNLPATSQVTNAAGKFMIVAPNTDSTVAKLEAVRQELDAWFLKHSYGQAGIGLAWQPAACNDFRRKSVGATPSARQNSEISPYRALIDSLFKQMEKIKAQRYQLCGSVAPIVFNNFLDSFNNELGVCRIDGHSPAIIKKDGDAIGEMARDQIEIGQWLIKSERILLTRSSLNRAGSLNLPVFGYHVTFVESEDLRGKFGQEAKSGNLLRAWDFSLPLPESGNEALWNGYARRAVNAYIPIFDEASQTEHKWGKYHGVEEELILGAVKTLSHLACEDRMREFDCGSAARGAIDHEKQWYGISALTILKGDVDNLGLIFQKGLGNEASFSKTAALSRQMNNFFAVYLPWLCKSDPDFKNTYTVFAGGDDFFLIGPWFSQIKLAYKMKEKFSEYVAHNKDVHFSAGLSTTKPGLPIPYLSDLAEKALEQAKTYNPKLEKMPAPKNAVSCFNQCMFWEEFLELRKRRDHLEELTRDLDLSTGYLYSLLNLVDMAEKMYEKPENALWRSYFAYRTMRMLERRKGLTDEQRKRRQQELAHEIAECGIERHGGNYRVALFSYLYQQRGYHALPF
jgi:CRISPR-associated protein Csm1